MTLIEWILQHDVWLQGIAVCVSAIGISVSMWLTVDVCREFRTASVNGPLTYLIARSHRRSQLVILALQVGFATISLFVLFLPTIPLTMGPSYRYVLLTITVRKMLRLVMIVLLTIASIRQAADRKLIYQVLAKE